MAQLGQVEPRYQLALEIAAGARLGNIVVVDDRVAAAAIALLKRERAGRATFLPLNQMARPKTLPPIALVGCVDYALNLVTFEPQYAPIFAMCLAARWSLRALRRRDNTWGSIGWSP